MSSTIAPDSPATWPSSDLELPPDLNLKIHRIIAQHFYGVDPHDQAEPDRTILGLAFQRDVERLKVYAELDPKIIVAALGGDVFPSAPIREVG